MSADRLTRAQINHYQLAGTGDTLNPATARRLRPSTASTPLRLSVSVPISIATRIRGGGRRLGRIDSRRAE